MVAPDYKDISSESILLILCMSYRLDLRVVGDKLVVKMDEHEI